MTATTIQTRSGPSDVIKRLLRRAGLRRHRVAAARMFLERNVLAATHRGDAREGGRILCYHSLGQPRFGVNDVSPGLFRRQIELALGAGFRFVAPEVLARTGGGARDLAVTFDDGLRSVLTHGAPILAEYGIPWAVFVVSDWANGGGGWPDATVLSWRDLEHVRSVAEIGSHSASHPDIGGVGAEQLAHELGESRRAIARHLGIEVTSFAIPFGQSANWSATAQEAARAAGYDLVYAQAEQTRPAGTIPRTFVTRFDRLGVFRSLLAGAFDHWEEWV